MMQHKCIGCMKSKTNGHVARCYRGTKPRLDNGLRGGARGGGCHGYHHAKLAALLPMTRLLWCRAENGRSAGFIWQHDGSGCLVEGVEENSRRPTGGATNRVGHGRLMEQKNEWPKRGGSRIEGSKDACRRHRRESE